MRIKYDKELNKYVLLDFLTILSKHYLFPIFINLIFFFFLFFINSQCLINNATDGINVISIKEILLILLSLIPLVNAINALASIDICISKIMSGDYFVNRYSFLRTKGQNVVLTDINNNYFVKDCISKKMLKPGETIDVIYINNNYGNTIWNLLIYPKNNKE